MSEPPVVALRARTAADLDLMFEIEADLDTWEQRSPAAPAPLTRARFDARQAAQDSGDADGTARFVVEADGAAVGGLTLFATDELARHVEMGISLAPAARGRGIGTAAIGLALEFAFVRRNLRRVHLQAVASNTAALRAYEKAGFVVEGRQREHAWVRGHYEDIVLMAVLRSQWSPAG